jgi:hypothetical protein
MVITSVEWDPADLESILHFQELDAPLDVGMSVPDFVPCSEDDPSFPLSFHSNVS